LHLAAAGDAGDAGACVWVCGCVCDLHSRAIAVPLSLSLSLSLSHESLSEEDAVVFLSRSLCVCVCVCVCDLPSRAIAVPMLSNPLIIHNLLGSAATAERALTKENENGNLLPNRLCVRRVLWKSLYAPC
jgi:hypothetical protein